MMKTLLFRMSAAAMIAAAVIALSSCVRDKKPDPKPNVNTLKVEPSADITFEMTGNLDVTFTVTTNADVWDYEIPDWINSVKADDKLIVSVSDNTGDERKGVIRFTAGDATPVTVNVTQKGYDAPTPSTHPSLQGSAYIVLMMDPVTFASIESKVIMDVRPDDPDGMGQEGDRHLYVWNGYDPIPQIGGNFYGLVNDGVVSWFAVKVASGATWSGAGLKSDLQLSMPDEFDEEWYFHMAAKCNRGPHGFKVWGAGGGDTGKLVYPYSFGIGGQFDDVGGHETYLDRFPDIVMNGEWQEYEIPVADMIDVDWKPWIENDDNLYSVISGADGDKTLELDAMFFYKK